MPINTAVILAAGVGSRLKNIFSDKPKGFLPIGGTTLVERSIKLLKESGISKIYIVTGHLSHFYQSLESDTITCLKNSDYKNTGSFRSLLIATKNIKENILILESDLLYERKALTLLINHKKENVILASSKTNSGDEVFLEVDENCNLVNISKNREIIKSIYAEFVGISKITNDTLISLYDWSKKNKKKSKNFHYENAFSQINDLKKIYVQKVESLIWSEIDNEKHYKNVIKEILPKIEI